MESRVEAALSMGRVADAILLNLPFGFDIRALHATVPRLDSLSQTVEGVNFALAVPTLTAPTRGKFFSTDRAPAAKRILKEAKDAYAVPGVLAVEIRVDARDRTMWLALLEVQITAICGSTLLFLNVFLSNMDT